MRSVKFVFPAVACLLLLCCATGCTAQDGGREAPNHTTPARLDSELATMFRFMGEKSDSLPYEYADTFELKVAEALRDPATFAYPFDSLRASGVEITESDDGRIRVFNWLHPWSGTWRHFPAIIQARVSPDRYTVQNAKVFCEEESFPHVWFKSIGRLDDSLYLVHGVGQFMGNMPFEVVFGYRLGDTGVSDNVPLFYEPDLDTLVSAYYVDKLWYLRNADKFDYTVPLVMEYRKDVRELSFPELIDGAGEPVVNDVMGDNAVHPSGDTVRLRFNGRFFAPVAGE